MKKLKINLFGEGIKISELIIKDDEKQVGFNEISHLNGHQFNETIQTDRFFETLEHSNRKEIVNGLSNTYKNQIEIWYGGKKIQKLKLADLNPKYSLFPLYQTSLTEFAMSQLVDGVYCEEREVGLIACYGTVLETFNIQELVFEIQITESAVVLAGLTYKHIRLKSIKSDTLLTRQFYFQNKYN